MPKLQPCQDCGTKCRGERCRECWKTHTASVPGWRAGQRGTCSIEDCHKPHVARGCCAQHYARLKRHGSPDVLLKKWGAPGTGLKECPNCGFTRASRGLCRSCWNASLSRPGCLVEGCEDEHHTGGYCGKHAHRVRRHGSPDGGRLRSIELVKNLPKPNGDCIEWPQEFRNRAGYGRAAHAGKVHPAHRFVWEQQVGPIPAGLELDHLCNNPPCVNVDHLEPVTGTENKRRRWIRWWARQPS